MKRALAGDPTSSAEKGSAPAAPTATESFTVGRLLRRGTFDKLSDVQDEGSLLKIK
ncbi:unnamed protein product, partial [Symbiodinium pilosum]